MPMHRTIPWWAIHTIILLGTHHWRRRLPIQENSMKGTCKQPNLKGRLKCLQNSVRATCKQKGCRTASEETSPEAVVSPESRIRIAKGCMRHCRTFYWQNQAVSTNNCQNQYYTWSEGIGRSHLGTLLLWSTLQTYAFFRLLSQNLGGNMQNDSTDDNSVATSNDDSVPCKAHTEHMWHHRSMALRHFRSIPKTRRSCLCTKSAAIFSEK